MRVPADQRYNVRKRIHVVYLHFILFRMHGRVIATGIKLDISIQMAMEQVLAQWSTS